MNVSPLKKFKCTGDEWQVVVVLHCNVIQATVVNKERQVLPFFSVKLAPTGEEDVRMIPADSTPWIYSSMAFLSGPERE